jgi:hypothetical protein
MTFKMIMLTTALALSTRGAFAQTGGPGREGSTARTHDNSPMAGPPAGPDRTMRGGMTGGGSGPYDGKNDTNVYQDGRPQGSVPKRLIRTAVDRSVA